MALLTSLNSVPWQNFSKSTDVHAKMGHVSPTTPILGVICIRSTKSSFESIVKPIQWKSPLICKSQTNSNSVKTCPKTSSLFVYHKLHCLPLKGHSICHVNLTAVMNLNLDSTIGHSYHIVEACDLWIDMILRARLGCLRSPQHNAHSDALHSPQDTRNTSLHRLCPSDIPSWTYTATQ